MRLRADTFRCGGLRPARNMCLDSLLTPMEFEPRPLSKRFLLYLDSCKKALPNSRT